MTSSETRGFNLDAFAGPIGRIELSIGTAYVYQANETVRDLFRGMANESPEQRAKATLLLITSLEVRKRLREPITPIPPESFAALTEDDLASLAELFRKRLDRQRALPESPLPAIEPQMTGERALTFFDRVLGADIAETDKQAKVQLKRLMDSVKSPASTGWRQLPWPVNDNYLGRLEA